MGQLRWTGPAIAHPAMVMEGDHTGEVLQSVGARVSELLPRGELVTLEGLDHFAPVRAPHVVARTIVAFVDRVAA